MITDDPSIVAPALASLKKTFLTQKTKPLAYRKKQLQNLVRGINEMENDIHLALEKDLGASKFFSEIFSVRASLVDIEHTLKNFEQWAKPRSVDTTMLVGPATSHIQLEPFGVSLVIGAWNYPVYVTLPPVAQAMAAGNLVVLKPSEMAPHSSNVLAKLFKKYLDPECYVCLEGGFQVVNEMIKSPFDLIIFTGSPEKGRLVAKAAAENLVPCILELGGKSPTIVDEDTNMENAVLRVAQGRFTNAGQTCIAADYVLCHEKILKEFTRRLKEKVREFYGKDASKSDAWVKIVNEMHTQRLQGMLQENHGGEVVCGGNARIQDRFVEPTIISNPRLDSKVMTEEIFGPILPIIPFKKINDAIQFINERPKPLALYYFGYKNHELVVGSTSSGGYSQNETLFHIANSDLPFGGVQNSGLGSYHGIYGFNNCSHHKSVLRKMALNMFPYNARYPPYTEGRKNVFLFLFKTMNFTQAALGKSLLFVLGAGMGYRFYTNGQFSVFLETMKPYINKTMSKMSKL